MKLFLRVRSPGKGGTVRHIYVGCKGRPTEALVRGIVTNKICALCGLLCHERNDPTMWLNFLDRFSLLDKGQNIVNDLNEANDGIVAINLSQDGLLKVQIKIDMYSVRRTCLMYGREDVPRHISVWVNLDIRSPRYQRPQSSSAQLLTCAIPSTSSENNLTLSRRGLQVVDKDLIFATTATEVSTAPWIGSNDDGARFMRTSASFPCVTASSMFNPAASEAVDVVVIVNSMIMPVLRRFPWESYLHSSRVIAKKNKIISERVQHKNINIQTSSRSFIQKHFDGIFRYTNENVLPDTVLDMEPTLQHGGA